MAPPGSTSPWLIKYIFPGGYVPSLSETLAAVERASLWVTDVEILRLHYAETLKQWHRRFQDNRDKVRSLYDERFCRMWEFYLQLCEVGYRRLNWMVFQAQLARSVGAVPLTRTYLANWDTAPK
jgi:cyclopropane-fatty-acyl-phospholipid synthase